MSLVAHAAEASRRARFLRAVRTRPAPFRWGVAILLPAALVPLAILRDDPQDLSVGRIYLVVVAVVAFMGGLGPALLATGLSFAALAWLFAPPGESPADTNQLGSLALFLVAAVVISDLIARREAAQLEAAAARERAERLQRVTAALVEAHTTQGVLDVMLEQGIAASQAARGAITLVSPDGRLLEVAARHNHPDSTVSDLGDVPLDAAMPDSEVVRTGEPLFLASRAERDKRFPLLAASREETHALAVLPLTGRSGTLGALVLNFPENLAFPREEREVLETIAHQCAQALERTRLVETEAKARRELSLQKAILEAESEASSDGILLVSPEGEMLSFNRRYIELWDLPPEVVASRSDAAGPDGDPVQACRPAGVLRAGRAPLREPRRTEPRRDRSRSTAASSSATARPSAAPKESSSGACGTSGTSPSCAADRRSPPSSPPPATCSPRPPRSRWCSSSSCAYPCPD